jgi:DNA-directed RNA polymerase alpha subunit
MYFRDIDELAVRFIEASLLKKESHDSEEELVNKAYKLAEIMYQRQEDAWQQTKKIKEEMKQLEFLKEDAIDPRIISETLDLPVRILNVLEKERITTIGRLTAKTQRELCRFGNLGKLGVRNIVKELGRLQISLKPD